MSIIRKAKYNGLIPATHVLTAEIERLKVEEKSRMRTDLGYRIACRIEALRIARRVLRSLTPKNPLS